jgi:hypothetical protein
MNRYALAAALWGCAFAVSNGQRTSATLDVGGTNVRYADSISATGLTVTPALALESRSWSLDATATLSKFSAGTSAQGSLFGSVFTPSFSSVTGEVGSSAGGSTHQDGSRTGNANAFGRLHFMRSRAGLWVGGGGGTTWDGAAWRGVRQADLGAWATTGPNATVTGTFTPTIVDDTIKYADSQLAVQWKLAKTDVGVTAGIRTGSRLPATPGSANAWGGLNVVSWISPTSAVVASAGTYPLDFTQGFPSGKYVSVALRFSSPRRSASLEPPIARSSRGPIAEFSTSRAGNETTFRIRATAAQSLEISGDFTQWDAVPMHAESGGWWTLTLPIQPGTYEMNVRMNGREWLVPPGLTTVKDEAGGHVGLLIVPNR